ncbi:MAG: Gldg family protein [Lachnospiraceae bacterium]|nr:Gldg family protein [Lachnospiraceae bacterium]
MIAIYKREVRSFFCSFIGWLYLAASLFILGLFFTAINMLSGYPNIAATLQNAIFLFLLIIPLLTMGSLAEDRKIKTDQLLFTAPVSIGRVVWGKYLALLTFLAIPLVVIGITPIILSFYDAFQMGISYTALLGFFLYGALALSLGLFVSSLTESVVIAAVLGFLVIFLGYMMAGICSLISQTGNIVTKVLSALDMVGRFDEMTGGSFYVPSVIYYVTFILFMLLCTIQSLQKRRYIVSGRGLKIGAYSAGTVIVGAVLTIVVNIVVNQLPTEFLSIDVTSDRLYTLSDETKELLFDLSEDVTIYILANEDYKDAALDKTVKMIEDLSGHITVSYVDPSANPLFYSNYTGTAPEENSLIVVGPKRSRVINYNDIYEYDLDYAYYQETGETSYRVTGFDGEGQITSALAYVTTEDMPKIYMITGHGELVPEGQYTRAIQKENVEYEELSLLSVEEIPEDAQAVILDAPTSDYSKDDVDKVIAFLEKGKNAILIPTWTNERLTNFEKILDYYGVSVADGIIVEQDMSMYYSIPFYLFPKINYDEITKSVFDAAVFAPDTQGLLYDEKAEGIIYTPLLETSEEAYSKTDLETATNYEKSEGDIDGPFVIALKAEKSVAEGMVSKAVIVATEGLFTESADEIVPGNNVKLFGSVIGALVEHESSISIPIKYYDTNMIIFTRLTCMIVGLISIILIPVCCLITGFIIWFKRRRQ